MRLGRKIATRAFNCFAILAVLLGISVLVSIFATLIIHGLEGFSYPIFTQSTPAPLETGGLINAIVGSLMITGLAIIIATPIGIMAATFITEYGRYTKVARPIQFINDILLSAPSIIIGLFVYAVVVASTGGKFSAYSGSIALAIIAIPIILRTTEDMLKLVPYQLREAAAALGTPQWKIISFIVYKAARNGIFTGILLAVARITGETAPLLFTALNNQFFSTSMSEPMANLPVVIFRFAMSPYANWQALAWTGALLVTMFILILSAISLYLRRQK